MTNHCYGTLAERREVTLTVTVEEGQSSLADFAGRISSDDAQEMREVIEREFERVDPLEVDPEIDGVNKN